MVMNRKQLQYIDMFEAITNFALYIPTYHGKKLQMPWNKYVHFVSLIPLFKI